MKLPSWLLRIFVRQPEPIATPTAATPEPVGLPPALLAALIRPATGEVHTLAILECPACGRRITGCACASCARQQGFRAGEPLFCGGCSALLIIEPDALGLRLASNDDLVELPAVQVQRINELLIAERERLAAAESQGSGW